MPAIFVKWKDGVRLYEVDCLGWCKKKIITNDPACVRYCPKCRRIKESLELKMSRTAMNVGNNGKPHMPGVPSYAE